jgi:hypothetical protein
MIASSRVGGSSGPRSRRRRASLLGTAAGGAFGLAGIAEARRLANGDQATLVRSARTTGPVRALAGSLLLAQPRVLLAAVGAGSRDRAPDWLVRMVAVREIILGIGLLSTARRQRDPRPWLLCSAATDGAECVVVLDAIARRQLPSIPALGFAAADVGGALVAAGVLAQQRRDRARRSAPAGAAGLPAPGSAPPGASCREGPS